MTKTTFTHGKAFEELLVQGLLLDSKFAEQMTEVLEVDYFSQVSCQIIVEAMFDFYKQYKSFPSVKYLEEKLLHDDLNGEEVQPQKLSVQKFFRRLHEGVHDADIRSTKDRALEWCRRTHLIRELQNCMDLIEDLNFDALVNNVQKAVAAGAEKDRGHVYEDQLEERMTEATRMPVATPWKMMNDIIGGGVSAGELAVILALTGVGKSHVLVDVGAAAAMAGKTVVHFSYELGEVKLGKRYDARISGIPYDDLTKHKDYVENCVNNLPGVIRIKKYPNRYATVQTIRNYLAKLKVENVVPDLIICDYADIMKSSGKKYENKRFEEEAVYEELRSLADELNMPIWTASQTNRSGMDVEILTLKHIAECFAKANIADLFLTMNRKKTGEHETLGNFFLAKSRLGPDGVKINVLVNTALSKITCLEPGSQEEREAMLKHDLQLETDQDRMRKKLEEMRSKGSFGGTYNKPNGRHENEYKSS